jgi:HPt (histidine-containing phosphotransfer) domain-containing protein
MLVRFADGQAATFTALRAAVASGDSAAAAKHAHAIAGAAGNLGADDLRIAAKALERAGRDGRKDLSKLLDDLEAQAVVVFRSIDTLREGGARVPAQGEQVLVPLAARPILERLQLALSNFDLSGASSALAEVEAIAIPGVSELAAIRNHVDRYEYDEARVLVTRLLEQIGTGVS